MLKKVKTIYLDYAATTPLDLVVKKAMELFLAGKFGNPSSLYQKGREAKAALEESRRLIANVISARPKEIIFTAGGTESVNLAIFGVARNYKSTHHLIASAIEHHCVLNSFKALEGEGYKTSLVGVDQEGFIKLDELKKAVCLQTVLISVMLANNEIGTVEPVGEIAKWLKGLNQERTAKGLPKILLHTDACQATGALDLNVEKLGVDLMSVNGSKIYGPKQTGFLYVRSGVNLKPLIYGGGQEWGMRSGTENVAGAVGLAKALEIVQKNADKENKRLNDLSDYLVTEIKSKIKLVLLNGPDKNKLKAKINKSASLIRLPNNVNFTFQGVEGEALMLYLDAYGFSVSTASACSTANPNEPSHVLLAMGLSKSDSQSSIRFSLGKYTSKSDLISLMKILPKLVTDLRKVKNK
jgi:cysteine desulfurase